MDPKPQCLTQLTKYLILAQITICLCQSQTQTPELEVCVDIYFTMVLFCLFISMTCPLSLLFSFHLFILSIFLLPLVSICVLSIFVPKLT